MRSEIVLHDLQSRTGTVLPGHDGLIEAPNWAPDGAALIVNGHGRIFRVLLDAPALVPVDRGFATRCNNDHGVSPDGRHVLYLAYKPGTLGHPAGKHVALRVMPQSGGDTEILAIVFGGQGTLNVPCWSPDSRRFAYMRFSPDR